MTVTIAICTYRRNAVLADLITTIDRLTTEEQPGLRILVVDDSPTGDAAATVARTQNRTTVDIDYRATASSNIAVARNRALADGREGSKFIACLDDDCMPHPQWLSQLLRIAHEYGADVVVGHRQFVATPDAPRWLREQPFLTENERYADGSIPASGNIANVLLRSSWLTDSGVTFRDAMGVVGGEDMVFFADARRAGANIRFAALSVCDEPCVGRRATYRYQLWRQIWLGNNEAAINRMTRATSRVRLLGRGLKRLVVGALRPLGNTMRRRPGQWRWGAATMGNGCGLLLGVVGVRLRHRS